MSFVCRVARHVRVLLPPPLFAAKGFSIDLGTGGDGRLKISPLLFTGDSLTTMFHFKVSETLVTWYVAAIFQLTEVVLFHPL